MPNAGNVNKVQLIEEDLKSTGAVWVVDYRGLSVKQAEDLRHRLTEVGAVMKIYKNTLTKIALGNCGLPDMGDVLTGPSAFVFSGDDFAASAKVLKTFAKESEDTLAIKGGLLEGDLLDAAQVQAIADLPSKEALVGQVAGLISSMARGLAVSISGISRGVALATKAVAEQKPAA